MQKLPSLLASFALAAGVLSAHFVWMEGPAAKLAVGQTTEVRIGNGHDISESESPLKFDGGEAFAITPSGKRVALKPQVSGQWLSAPYEAREAGLHRFQFVQDRGPISRVDGAYLAGGRDSHPTADRSIYSWRTATSFGRTGAEKVTLGKPLGLPLELLAESVADGFAFTVMRDGKPVQGVEVGVVWPGDAQAEPFDKSDGKGRLSFKRPANAKGPVLFVAAVVDPAPHGAHYDTRNLTAAVHLYW